ncbi:MAG TPA: aspartate/glutamate racemase family protein [Caulobacteraceae bacterium]|nr:aspartate/glutamate racemase family protein [Caulobacteraceae bacterium]
MKTLGLIGGMSWESTAVYYRLLNRLARAALGGHHSAPLLIWSVDFAPIAAMQAQGDWEGASAVMVEAARKLETAGADAVLICANTMHRMADEVAASVAIPLIHIAEVTSRAVRAAGARRPLLLATRYTMEQAFYRDRLEAGGVSPVIPPRQARARLQAIIFDELVQGRIEAASRAAFVDIVTAAVAEEEVDAAILGCTEFGLLVDPADLPVPSFDTTELHARAAMDFALED